MKQDKFVNPERKKKIKKQLVSVGVYIALAAIVVGITSNSVKKILSGSQGYEIPSLDDTNDTHISLPKLTEPNGRLPSDLPDQTEYKYPDNAVSDLPEGISAELYESDPVSDNQSIPDESVSGEPQNIPSEPTDPQSTPSFDGEELPTVRVRPVMGYISREYSADELIYTPTMNDFRTHTGIDLASDVGTPVSALADGVVADVYDDPFMGTTVVLKHAGGLVSSYSNLSSELPKEITVGATVSVGSIIGGIGETAIIESAEAPHVHLEVYLDEQCVNPEEYLPQG